MIKLIDAYCYLIKDTKRIFKVRIFPGYSTFILVFFKNYFLYQFFLVKLTNQGSGILRYFAINSLSKILSILYLN
jgi:hypothetical protein